MSLLELDGVQLRARERQRERTVLGGVSLAVRTGELVMVWGTRRSGRTSLLRIAAGIQAPDAGVARFEGRPLGPRAQTALGSGIGYVQKGLRAREEQSVLEQVAAALLASGLDVARARDRAREAIVLAGAERCSALRVDELRGGEAIRVAFARALAPEPRLLVVDEPTATVELDERDEILTLLRSLATRGIAVLATTGEPSELAGAHRALTLSDGELRGESVPELAPVVTLRRAGM